MLSYLCCGRTWPSLRWTDLSLCLSLEVLRRLPTPASPCLLLKETVHCRKASRWRTDLLLPHGNQACKHTLQPVSPSRASARKRAFLACRDGSSSSSSSRDAPPLSPTVLSVRLRTHTTGAPPHTHTRAHGCSLANWQCTLGATLDRSRFLLLSHQNSSGGNFGCLQSVSTWERGETESSSSSACLLGFLLLLFFSLSFFFVWCKFFRESKTLKKWFMEKQLALSLFCLSFH